MKAIVMRAPAKINLTLDVTGIRPDGYHTIRSVMQTVDLCDRITVSICEQPGIVLSLSDPALPTGRDNIAFRAAEVFMEQSGWRQGLNIEVEKHIPMQAGMAGGSADAAGVLVALGELSGAGIPTEELCAWGLRIGADVPFCIRGGCALAEGIGERLTPLPVLPECWIAVVKPEAGVSTAEAYRRVDRAILSRRPDTETMAAALHKGDLADAAQAVCNVFEEGMALEEVAAIRTAMRAYSPLGRQMTGSGSAVFALFEDESRACDCARALSGLGNTFVCRPWPAGPVREEAIV